MKSILRRVTHLWSQIRNTSGFRDLCSVNDLGKDWCSKGRLTSHSDIVAFQRGYKIALVEALKNVKSKRVREVALKLKRELKRLRYESEAFAYMWEEYWNGEKIKVCHRR